MVRRALVSSSLCSGARQFRRGLCARSQDVKKMRVGVEMIPMYSILFDRFCSALVQLYIYITTFQVLLELILGNELRP